MLLNKLLRELVRKLNEIEAQLQSDIVNLVSSLSQYVVNIVNEIWGTAYNSYQDLRTNLPPEDLPSTTSRIDTLESDFAAHTDDSTGTYKHNAANISTEFNGERSLQDVLNTYIIPHLETQRDSGGAYKHDASEIRYDGQSLDTVLDTLVGVGATFTDTAYTAGPVKAAWVFQAFSGTSPSYNTHIETAYVDTGGVGQLLRVDYAGGSLSDNGTSLTIPPGSGEYLPKLNLASDYFTNQIVNSIVQADLAALDYTFATNGSVDYRLVRSGSQFLVEDATNNVTLASLDGDDLWGVPLISMAPAWGVDALDNPTFLGHIVVLVLPVVQETTVGTVNIYTLKLWFVGLRLNGNTFASSPLFDQTLDVTVASFTSASVGFDVRFRPLGYVASILTSESFPWAGPFVPALEAGSPIVVSVPNRLGAVNTGELYVGVPILQAFEPSSYAVLKATLSGSPLTANVEALTFTSAMPFIVEDFNVGKRGTLPFNHTAGASSTVGVIRTADALVIKQIS